MKSETKTENNRDASNSFNFEELVFSCTDLFLLGNQLDLETRPTQTVDRLLDVVRAATRLRLRAASELVARRRELSLQLLHLPLGRRRALQDEDNVQQKRRMRRNTT